MSPSPRRSTTAGEASRALEERDDAWRTMQEDELERLRRRNRVLEEETVHSERIIGVLEKERGVLECEFGRLETKRGEELLRRNLVLENEVNGLRRVSVKAEKEGEVVAVKGMEERACKLVGKNYGLEKEIDEMRGENERILNEKARKEAELKAILVLEEEKRRAMEEENSKLADRVAVLEGQKAGMEAEVEKRKVRAEEAEKRVSDHWKTIRASEREKEASEARVLKVDREKSKEIARILNEKMALVAEVRKAKKDKRSESERIRDLEAKVMKVDREKSKEIERILNEKKRLVDVRNDRISELARRNRVLEKEKAKVDAELLKANKDNSDASARLVEVKNALEREKEASEAKVLEEEKRRAIECQLNEENTKLTDRIEVLERDRGAMEAEVSKKEMERNCVTLRMQNVKKDLEDEKRRLEEKVSELAKRIVVLEREKAGMEAEVEKARIDKSHEYDRVVEVNKALEAQKLRAEDAEKQALGHLKTIKVLEAKVMKAERLLNEKRRLVEVEHEKVSELEKRNNWAVEREKAKMDAEVRKVNKDKSDAIVELKKALEAQMRRAEAAEMRVSQNLIVIGFLKRAKEASKAEVFKVDIEKSTEIVRISKEKMDLVAEKGRLEEEMNKTISDHVKRIEILERERAELEAEVCKVNTDKNNESYKIVELKKALEAQKRRAEEAIAMNAKREKRKEIERIWNGKKTMEDEGTKRIEGGLEREKKEMETKFRQADKEKREEIQIILNKNTAIEAEKRAMKDAYEKKNFELADRISIMEKEKWGFEADIMDKNAMIKMLYEEAVVLGKKAEMEAQAHKEKKDVSNELNKALETQKRLGEEAKKRVSGFVKTIMVLEREKEALAAKVSKLYEEKRKVAHNIELLERIHIYLNGNEAEKDDYEKKNSELADRINFLEMEKRGLEASIREKDEVIMVSDREHSCLEDLKKELEIVIKVLASKLKEDAHLTENLGTLSTPWRNEGVSNLAYECVPCRTNSAGVAYSSEHHGSVNDNVENPRKRKRSIIKCEVVDDEPVLVPCEKNTEMINSSLPTNGSTGSDVMVACRWEADQDLLDAFEVDPELCLKAVCALYRQHKRLPDSANTSLSPGSRVFKPEYMCRAIAFGQFLTTEDPECSRMKELVRKLNRLDPLAVGVCRSIAKQHYHQVFEIYKKKEDPLFLS